MCRFTCLVLKWIFKGLLPLLSELSKKKQKKTHTTKQERSNKLMPYPSIALDEIPDGAVSLQWANIPAHIQVSLEAPYWPSQQCRSENKLPCGAQMSKELSSLAPLSVNRPPACTYLQVRIQPPAEFSKALAAEPCFYIHLHLILTHRLRHGLSHLTEVDGNILLFIKQCKWQFIDHSKLYNSYTFMKSSMCGS